MQQHFIPEDRLCLLLARGSLSSPARDEAMTLLAGPLQWDMVLERAKAHEVYPLLYRNLKDLGFPGTPSSVRTELEVLFRTNALHNSLLAKELAQLLGALHDAEIPVIPLKGLSLAQSLYGDLSLRVCVDLDILVPRQNVAQAADLLSTKGYQMEFPRWFLRDRRMRNSIECPLWKRERSLEYLLELHWGVLYDTGREEENMKDLWAEAQKTDFLGIPVYSLSQEGQLLMLAAHAARHNWQGLKWLADIHELCLHRDLELDRTAALARQFGWEQLLGWSLGACRILLDTPLAPDFARGTPPHNGSLFSSSVSHPTPFQTMLIHVRFTKGPFKKLRFILRRILVPTPSDAELFHFSESFAFLYYFLRPFRLVGSLFGMIFHRWGKIPTKS